MEDHERLNAFRVVLLPVGAIITIAGTYLWQGGWAAFAAFGMMLVLVALLGLLPLSLG
jgi:hypothetical protein